MTDPGRIAPGVTVRMAVHGNAVEPRRLDEVIDIIKSRLAGPAGRPLAVSWVDLDRTRFGEEALEPRIEWLPLARRIPLAWRGQLLTTDPWPRVAASDVLPTVLRLVERYGDRTAFLGANTRARERVNETVSREYPRLTVAGAWSTAGDESPSLSAKLADEINDARADVLIIDLDESQGNRWINRYGAHTGARLCVCTSGAFDMLAGSRPGARQWIHHLDFEPLYRITREPRRLGRRYLIEGPAALLRRARARFLLADGVYYAVAPERAVYPAPSSVRLLRWTRRPATRRH